MGRPNNDDTQNNIIATIINTSNSEQNIDILYLKEKNAFLTFGINNFFAEKEILIPAYLGIGDFNLVGAIVSAILEKMSQVSDNDGYFEYPAQLVVLGCNYSLTEDGEYMILEKIE
jgi:hypothetical protein